MMKEVGKRCFHRHSVLISSGLHGITFFPRHFLSLYFLFDLAENVTKIQVNFCSICSSSLVLYCAYCQPVLILQITEAFRILL